MARSRPLSPAAVALPALGLAAAAAAVTYLLTTDHGRRTRDAVAGTSAQWLRAHTPDVQPQLARIERQIDALGTDLRRRLDHLQEEMQPLVDASFHVDRTDVRHDLPGMPG